MIVRLVLMVPVLIRAVYTDMRDGKIENRLVLAAFISGVFLVGATGGAAGLFTGVKMAFIMTAALLVLFMIGGLGAGDIKLMAVISLCFPKQCVMMVITAFIIAGVIAIFKMLFRAVKRERIYIRGETIHFSIPILISFGVVMIFVR